MADVFHTDEFETWFDELTGAEQEVVVSVVRKLEVMGVNLTRPHSGDLSDGLRELRPRQGGSPIRVLYRFDPKRDAVLLIGGDKSGDNKFYDRLIPIAERIWAEYLAEQAAGLHDS